MNSRIKSWWPRYADGGKKWCVGGALGLVLSACHLAFGTGHHFCRGANLARMEFRVALRELLRNLPDMQFADAGPIVEPHALVRSCTRMEICFTKESR